MNFRAILHHLRAEQNPDSARQLVEKGLLRRLAAQPGLQQPGNVFYRIGDQLSLRDVSPVTELLKHTREVAENLDHAAFSSSPPRRCGRAFVVILRGLLVTHLLPHYLIAHALRQTGYQVEFLICSGHIETCGVAQEGDDPEVETPLTCRNCRQITEDFYRSPFPVTDLTDLRDDKEDHLVRDLSRLSWPELLRWELEDLPIGRLLRPHLLRVVRGNLNELKTGSPRTRRQVLAGVRYQQRLQNFCRFTPPDVVVLFNGLFNPEVLWRHWLERLGTTVICTERGARRDTLFLSRSTPACFYNADPAWEEWESGIGPEHPGLGRQWLEKRLETLENPHGEHRVLPEFDEKRIAPLAREGFVLFFAGVTHDTAGMMSAWSGDDFHTGLLKLCRLAESERKNLVVRCHPDELDPKNPSRYGVAQFLADHGFGPGHAFVHVFGPEEKWNPYRLAETADAIVMHNGSLGMELAGLGWKIFNLGRSHYARKGFTADIEDDRDFPHIFQARQPRLDPSEQDRALAYLYFFQTHANLPIDAFYREASRYNIRTPTDDADDPQRRAHQWEQLRRRLALLLPKKNKDFVTKL